MVPCYRRCLTAVVAHVMVLFLVLATAGSAYPFGRGAAVTEVTPASFNDFVNSHKPVVMLFYAPWCGHCKNFEAEYIRFAESVKGTVRVGAVNADTHASLGQQYGVRGFPTIKYWGAGKKSVGSPQDYQGPRTAAALQQLITSGISEENVKTGITSLSALEAVVRESPLKRAAVLFSRKSKVPAMFSVLSLSRQLQSLPFVFIGGESGSPRALQEALGVVDVPAVALVALNDTTQQLDVVPYAKKKLMYEPIAKFFLSCLDSADGTAAPLCAATRTSADSVGDNAAAHSLDGETFTAASTATEGQKRAPKRLAPPVGPIAFSADTFASYCSPTGAKMGGAAPLCVVLTSPTAAESAATDLYNAFEHDPIIVFVANTAEARAEMAQHLSSTVQLTLDDEADGERTAALAYRHARTGIVRFKRFASLDTVADDLQRILSGDLRLDTQRLPVA